MAGERQRRTDMMAERPPLDPRWQFTAYFSIALLALVSTAIVLPSTRGYFQRYFGEVDAILVTVVAMVAGAGALWVLRSRCGFEILRGQETLHGMGLSAVLATILGVAIIIADLISPYPEDTNAPVPQALLFYPAIGFVAEMAFHVVPLALVLVALTPIARRVGRERVTWAAIAFVAAAEPTFQVLFAGTSLAWSHVYTWIHIFAIAFLQLYVFRRFDFVSMYVFRLVYYVYWHILWGVVRLKVLF